MPRIINFHRSDLDKENPSLLNEKTIIKTKADKNKRIPLNPRGENSRRAILINGKFMAQNNTAKSINKSVVPNFLYSSMLTKNYSG
jgi:hypothetical protein